LFYYNETILQQYRASDVQSRLSLYDQYPYLREIFNSIDLEECVQRKKALVNASKRVIPI
jgi:hypothetical protein